MADVLHVGDRSFDPEDLTFAEKREVRRLVRTELWDEDMMGGFDWVEVPEEEVIAATVAVWMKREDPSYTLERALELKPREVMGLDKDDKVPPTSPKRASARKKTSAAAGTGA